MKEREIERESERVREREREVKGALSGDQRRVAGAVGRATTIFIK